MRFAVHLRAVFFGVKKQRQKFDQGLIVGIPCLGNGTLSKSAGARSEAKIWPGGSCRYTLPWGWVLVQRLGLVLFSLWARPKIRARPPPVFGGFLRLLQSSWGSKDLFLRPRRRSLVQVENVVF